MPKEREQMNPPEGGYGWVVVAAVILLHSTLIPITLCFGIIYEEKFTELNIPASQTSFLLHLHNSLMCFLGLFSGPLIKQFENRQIIIVGVLLSCLSIFLTTFAESYTALMCTVGIMLGSGMGIIMPSMYMMVNSYFKKRLPLAMSFQVTGTSVAGIFMPQVCDFLLKYYGLTGTVLIFAGISLNAIPAALLMRPARKITSEKVKTTVPIKEEQDAKIDEDSADKLLPTSKSTPVLTRSESRTKRLLKSICTLFEFKLLTQRTYVIVAIGMGISFAAELNTVLMTSFVLKELSNFETKELATATSILSLMDLIGRLFLPYIAYKQNFPPKFCYVSALVGSTVGRTLLCFTYNNKESVLVSVGLLGLGKGAKAVFQALILPYYIPYETLAYANGLLMVINGMLSLSVGPIIGVIHDVSNSYLHSLHFTSALSMCCVIIWTVDYLLRRMKQNPVDVESAPMECNINET